MIAELLLLSEVPEKVAETAEYLVQKASKVRRQGRLLSHLTCLADQLRLTVRSRVRSDMERAVALWMERVAAEWIRSGAEDGRELLRDQVVAVSGPVEEDELELIYKELQEAREVILARDAPPAVRPIRSLILGHIIQ